MSEFAITLGIALVLIACGLLALIIGLSLVNLKKSKQVNLYWSRNTSGSCPNCGAKYAIGDAHDLCITRLVDCFYDPNTDDTPDVIEPFLGQREFRCSHCGTVAVYERKDGPAELHEVTTPDDVCYVRRCLECNDVFSLPAYGKCPVCGGKKLKLEESRT